MLFIYVQRKWGNPSLSISSGRYHGYYNNLIRDIYDRSKITVIKQNDSQRHGDRSETMPK